MKITKNSEQLITAEINAEEMYAFGLTYKEIDYSEYRTRKMLAYVIEYIRNQVCSDFSLKGGTVIEVMPNGENGCTLSFTYRKTHSIIRNTSLLLS